MKNASFMNNSDHIYSKLLHENRSLSIENERLKFINKKQKIESSLLLNDLAAINTEYLLSRKENITYKEEIENIKGKINEEVVFIKYFSKLVNQGIIYNLLQRDICMSVIKVEYLNDTMEKASQAKLIYTGHYPSKTIKIQKAFRFPNNNIIGSECPNNDIAKEEILRAIKKDKIVIKEQNEQNEEDLSNSEKENSSKQDNVISLSKKIDFLVFNQTCYMSAIILKNKRKVIEGAIIIYSKFNITEYTNKINNLCKYIEKDSENIVKKYSKVDSVYSDNMSKVTSSYSGMLQILEKNSLSLSNISQQVFEGSEKLKLLIVNLTNYQNESKNVNYIAEQINNVNLVNIDIYNHILSEYNNTRAKIKESNEIFQIDIKNNKSSIILKEEYVNDISKLLKSIDKFNKHIEILRTKYQY